MANEIKDFKVDQKSREVIVYSKGISDQKFNEVKRFKEMGYKITMLEREKPAKGWKGCWPPAVPGPDARRTGGDIPATGARA